MHSLEPESASIGRKSHQGGNKHWHNSCSSFPSPPPSPSQITPASVKKLTWRNAIDARDRSYIGPSRCTGGTGTFQNKMSSSFRDTTKGKPRSRRSLLFPIGDIGESVTDLSLDRSRLDSNQPRAGIYLARRPVDIWSRLSMAGSGSLLRKNDSDYNKTGVNFICFFCFYVQYIS